ncbi:MAG: sigma-70 family RNA polymerase sigma factor [Thermaerobacter sp.]|nr:sigma-70 family RNA polymerase sigma factor [Thermaerobacter sp.]
MAEGVQELVARAAADDEQAFAELVQPDWPRLYRLCLRFVQDPGRAEDLAQEALARAWLRLPQLRDGVAFTPWLLQTAANLAKNELRRRREDPVPDEVFERAAGDGDVASGLLRGEQRRRIELALAGLPPMQRVAVELVLRDEISYREAAGILGVPLGTLKTLVHRGRARLRAELSEEPAQTRGGTAHVKADY